MQGNWGRGLKGTFDVIISNPPYIPRAEISHLTPEVKSYDPERALDGGDDGLDCYCILANQLPSLCGSKAKVYLEIGQGQEKAVESLLRYAGFHCLSWRQDLAGINRCGTFRFLQKVN